MFSTFSIGEWLWHVFCSAVALGALSSGFDGIPVTVLIFGAQYFTVYKPLQKRSIELKRIKEQEKKNLARQRDALEQYNNYRIEFASSDFYNDCVNLMRIFLEMQNNKVFGIGGGNLFVVVPKDECFSGYVILDCSYESWQLIELLSGRLSIYCGLKGDHLNQAILKKIEFIVPQTSMEWEWCLLDNGVPSRLAQSVKVVLKPDEQVRWCASVWGMFGCSGDSLKKYPLISFDDKFDILKQLLATEFPQERIIVTDRPLNAFLTSNVENHL